MQPLEKCHSTAGLESKTNMLPPKQPRQWRRTQTENGRSRQGDKWLQEKNTTTYYIYFVFFMCFPVPFFHLSLHQFFFHFSKNGWRPTLVILAGRSFSGFVRNFFEIRGITIQFLKNPFHALQNWLFTVLSSGFPKWMVRWNHPL